MRVRDQSSAAFVAATWKETSATEASWAGEAGKSTSGTISEMRREIGSGVCASVDVTVGVTATAATVATGVLFSGTGSSLR